MIRGGTSLSQVLQPTRYTHGLCESLGVFEAHNVRQWHATSGIGRPILGLGEVQAGPGHFAGRQCRFGLFGAPTQKVAGRYGGGCGSFLLFI